MKKTLNFTLNGRQRSVEVEPNTTLLNLLREEYHLTGTKYGCGIGECAACTVLLDGKPVLSCQTLALTVEDHEVTTIEGLAKGKDLHVLQKTFLEEGAVQCGYCTPGMILSSAALLQEKPKPTVAEIRDALRGNICRCTGYENIIRAVQKAAGL